MMNHAAAVPRLVISAGSGVTNGLTAFCPLSNFPHFLHEGSAYVPASDALAGDGLDDGCPFASCPPALGGYLPTFPPDGGKQYQEMAATRAELETKIVAQFLKAQGKSQERIDAALLTMTPEARHNIIVNEIPAWEQNDGALTGLLLIGGLLLVGLYVYASAQASTTNAREKEKSTHPGGLSHTF